MAAWHNRHSHRVSILQYCCLGVVLLTQLLHDDLQNSTQLTLDLSELVPSLRCPSRHIKGLVDLGDDDLCMEGGEGGEGDDVPDSPLLSSSFSMIELCA